jgi:hypothetical protein
VRFFTMLSAVARSRSDCHQRASSGTRAIEVSTRVDQPEDDDGSIVEPIERQRMRRMEALSIATLAFSRPLAASKGRF